MNRPLLVGYAVTWNTVSTPSRGTNERKRDGRAYRTRFCRTAFSDSLRAGYNTAVLYHDPELRIGRTVDGTLRLSEDDFGLRFELCPSGDAELVERALREVRSGKLRGVSVEHINLDVSVINTAAAGEPIELVGRCDLVHIALVEWPAFRGTGIEIVYPGSAVGSEVFGSCGEHLGKASAREAYRSMVDAVARDGMERLAAFRRVRTRAATI